MKISPTSIINNIKTKDAVKGHKFSKSVGNFAIGKANLDSFTKKAVKHVNANGVFWQTVKDALKKLK